MKVHKSTTCVYCGTSMGVETRDHVPPKGFFKGIPNVAKITVPSCPGCNNGASLDDEKVRFWISMMVGTDTPGRMALWEQGAFPSVKGSATLQGRFMKNRRPHQRRDGTWTEAFDIPADTLHRVFSRIARGLHFHHYGEALPPAINVAIKRWMSQPTEIIEMVPNPRTERMGGDAFVYTFGREDNHKEGSMWIFAIHQAVWFMVFMDSPGKKIL